MPKASPAGPQYGKGGARSWGNALAGCIGPPDAARARRAPPAEATAIDIPASRVEQDVWVEVAAICGHLGIAPQDPIDKIKSRTRWRSRFILGRGPNDASPRDRFCIHVDDLPNWLNSNDVRPFRTRSRFTSPRECEILGTVPPRCPGVQVIAGGGDDPDVCLGTRPALDGHELGGFKGSERSPRARSTDSEHAGNRRRRHGHARGALALGRCRPLLSNAPTGATPSRPRAQATGGLQRGLVHGPTVHREKKSLSALFHC